MPDPTVGGAVTLAGAAASIPMVTAFGVPLGLRPDLLIAGFSGALVAITLLNTVPTTGDTWRQLVRDSLRRMAVAAASSLTAGYVTPILAQVQPPEPLLLGSAFLVGAAAQTVVARLVRRVEDQAGGSQ